MAFLQFPNIGYFRVIETGIESMGGYFNLDDGTELKHVMATIYIHTVGSLAGTEQLRFKLYASETATTAIASSDWIDISDIGAVGPDWIGNIYFDFDYVPLNPNINYHFKVEARNYTRNLEAFWIGVNLDWYSAVNTALSASEAGFRIRILGYR